ncbi:MAG: hypothetical protein ACK43M_11880 [Allorhizobium sp.]
MKIFLVAVRVRSGLEEARDILWHETDLKTDRVETRSQVVSTGQIANSY